MSTVRFISDLHLGHKTLIENLRHMSVEYHDNLIISNWNRVVTKRDITYVLGDFVMEDPNLIENYISKLNGQIRIIGGNHDDRKCCETYSKLGIPVLGCIDYKGCICTHIPIHPDEFNGWKIYNQVYRKNIHGHIHTRTYSDDRYINVSCELVDYTPRTLNELLGPKWVIWDVNNSVVHKVIFGDYDKCISYISSRSDLEIDVIVYSYIDFIEIINNKNGSK